MRGRFKYDEWWEPFTWIEDPNSPREYPDELVKRHQELVKALRELFDELEELEGPYEVS